MFRYRSTSCHLLPSLAISCHLLPSLAISCHLLPSLACASSSFSSEIRLCCNRGPSAFSPRWWMSQGILDQEYQEWTPRITIHELHWAASFGHEFLHYWTILDMDYDYDHHSWGIVLYMHIYIYIFPPIIHCSARDVGCLAALLSGPPVDLYSVLGNSWQQLHNQMAVVG